MRAGGQITVDTSRPFSGQKALHVTGMMNSDKAYIQTPLAITATTIFVRFMMYTAGYPSSSGVHTRLLRIGTAAGTAAGTAENSYSLSSYNGTAIEKVNSIYLRDTGTHFNDAGNKNRWICWEFEIDKTGGSGKGHAAHLGGWSPTFSVGRGQRHPRHDIAQLGSDSHRGAGHGVGWFPGGSGPRRFLD